MLYRLLLLWTFISSVASSLPKELVPTRGGIGFAFSGAGGRIGQHAALMEALFKGQTPDGRKIRPDFLSGASSGSLSAVILNAIVETEEKHLKEPYGVTWEFYKSALFNLTNDDVYDTSVEGIARIFTHNIFEGYILDNLNLKKMLLHYATRMNYTKFSDLYIPTSISIVNQSSGYTHRLWSDDPKNADLDLIEVIIASTSVPVAFPPATIHGLSKDLWIDGGTGIDTIPVYPLLHRKGCDEVYIICYGSALQSGGAHDLPFPINDILLLKNAIAALNDMRVDGAIDMAAGSSKKTFTFIPKLNQTFPMLGFDQEKLEYELTHQWALEHNPTPIN